MKVLDVMTRFVEFVDADATVQEAVRLMGELDVGALPVGGEQDLKGVVTDRDVLFRVVMEGRCGTDVKVGEIMSTMVFSCREDDSVETALDLMGSNQVRRLPVLDAKGAVVGWLTLSDVARTLLVDSGSMQSALRETFGAAA